MHSRHDELIPFRHSQLIYQRYVKLSKNSSVQLVEVQNLTHNELLGYIQFVKDNHLRRAFYEFLNRTEDN
jgi:hypothetical protein